MSTNVESSCAASTTAIQPYGSQTANFAPAPTPTTFPFIPCDGLEYVVKQGDHCAQLSELWDVYVKPLMEANGLINSGCSNLQINQTICIPGVSTTPEAVTKTQGPEATPTESQLGFNGVDQLLDPLKPDEQPPAEPKPTEKPEESEPSDPVPAEQPSEAPPPDEPKPDEQKPDEQKPQRRFESLLASPRRRRDR